jgi:hypothetical protein
LLIHLAVLASQTTQEIAMSVGGRVRSGFFFTSLRFAPLGVGLAGLLVGLLVSGLVHADTSTDQLTDYCASRGGKIISKWKCPADGTVRVTPQCRLSSGRGKVFVFDGCSGGGDRYGEIFFKACVLHDLCYHNEPRAHGLRRADCDMKLYQNAMEICETIAEEERGSCQGAAQSFYAAVRVFGRRPWQCSNDSAPYPTTLSEL